MVLEDIEDQYLPFALSARLVFNTYSGLNNFTIEQK